jgi:hypothetical protein
MIKGLKSLTQEVEKMEKMIERLETDAKAPRPRPKKPAMKPTARKKAKAKAARVPRDKTATAAVMEIVRQEPNGVTTGQIKEKTGLADRQIWAIINRAKKQGKVKSAGRGLYVMV